jgi:hypothetical protein
MRTSVVTALVCIAFGQATPPVIVAEVNSNGIIGAKLADECLLPNERLPVCNRLHNLLIRSRSFRTIRTDGIGHTALPTPTAAAQAMPPELLPRKRAAENTQDIKLSPPIANPPRIQTD